MDKIDFPEIAELSEKAIKASEKIFKNVSNNFSGYQHDLRDIALTYSRLYSKIFADPDEFKKVQDTTLHYMQKYQRLWSNVLERQTNKEVEPVAHTHNHDKRFAAVEWNEYPYFDFLKQNYLLMSEMFRSIINEVDVEEKTKKKLHFYTNQYIDAFSPSNYVFSNPEALKLAYESKGESLKKGFENLLSDIEKGHITQVDETAFEVGKNLAVTPGSVVYQNELIQLIQYSPSTANVYEIPLLILAPWINKYYILDLRPENSLAKFLVGQGFTVFMISWKNPTKEMRNISLDDYVDKGAVKAIEVIQEITNAKKVNMLGYCLGGTLLGVALSVMYARKEKSEAGSQKSETNSQKPKVKREENIIPVNTATFLAAMIDFADVGPMGDVIDTALVRKLERGELHKEGVMSGNDMEHAFNLIRVNDLIWGFVINNYLKGKQPTPFDVLYWTNDNTNLPAKMYAYYLRNMLLENRLSRKNALRICNVPIDIARIEIPTFVIGTREDHISPAHTVFTTTDLVSGDTQFLLGDSGHVMGVANPPSKGKYGYSVNGTLGEGFEEWKKTSEHYSGSWWTYWSEWLKEQSGAQITAPQQTGNEQYPEIEPAPGSYVKEKI